MTARPEGLPARSIPFAEPWGYRWRDVLARALVLGGPTWWWRVQRHRLRDPGMPFDELLMWPVFELTAVMLVLGLGIALGRKIDARTRAEPVPRAFGVAIAAVFTAQAVSAGLGQLI